MRIKTVTYTGLVALLFPAFASSQTPATSAEELSALRQQIEILQQRLTELERAQSQQETILANTDDTPRAQNDISVDEEPNEPVVTFGGAIRTNYSYTSYDDDSKNRGGDFDFDIFRINMDASIDDVFLSGEIRFFDYMTAIKYAYAGYNIDENWQMLVGITPVPFGNRPYNSQNWFFSTNYYLGLEDDFDLGLLFRRQLKDSWQLDVGFFKNDELGGVDGYVDNRADRYSYDVVGFRSQDEGIYADPANPVGEYNTFLGRVAYQFDLYDINSTIGASVLNGGIHGVEDREGDYYAWAVHAEAKWQNWLLQFQHTEYQYDVGDATQMAVGAYSFFDTIAAQAKSTTLNLAYTVSVDWGPVSSLQFYNNYGLVYDKSDDSRNTLMNVTGMAMAAGGLYTYFDLVTARNQPFAGGSAVGDSGETEQRFNINIGYYF
ncbi:carbohydrate porin [Alteromonas sp. ASW11-130]|uniref:carbohydrate porin n=1 Tax=Alteromonas sp. ASW11-130 TaxID=3015775 RepID=UPI00224267EF|nr:carbohydrate porin [Alteromonas sp. ASW11-130]MCW8090224.1 OprO/OprP family phosphate-selective porin [Alteromonas sp. ASW11-130]